MLAIFIKRVLMAIPVLLAVATMTFFLIKLAPGGPFDAEKAVSPQVLKNLNAVYNLDASQWEQYTDYMTGVVQGDFGPSFKYPGRSVTEMISSGLPITFELAMYAILIALVIGILSGVLAALKRNTMLDFIPYGHSDDRDLCSYIFNGSFISINIWYSIRASPSCRMGSAFWR
jgi:oligopeptide transport system permease protein